MSQGSQFSGLLCSYQSGDVGNGAGQTDNVTYRAVLGQLETLIVPMKPHEISYMLSELSISKD